MKNLLVYTLIASSLLLFSCSKDDDQGSQNDAGIRYKGNSLRQMNLRGVVRSSLLKENVSLPEGTIYSFNAAGMITSVGDTKTFTYDDSGRLSSYVNDGTTITFTYGIHDKYIYAEPLEAVEDVISPFLKGVVSVAVAAPDYNIVSTYSINGNSGAVNCSRTGSEPEEYTAVITFNGDSPSRIEYSYPDNPSKRNLYMLYYSPTSGNITRYIWDRGASSVEKFYSDNQHSFVHNINVYTNAGENVTQQLFAYHPEGDISQRITNILVSGVQGASLSESFSYDTRDAKGNWTTRKRRVGNSTITASREIIYY